MGSKLNPGKYDCYANALPDEPMFILLGRDPDAPRLIDEWALGRAHRISTGDRPYEDTAMVDEAYACAEAMREWRKANDGKWREPREIDLDTLDKVAVEIAAGRHFNKTPHETARAIMAVLCKDPRP